MILYIQGGRKLASFMMKQKMDVVHMVQVFIVWTICSIGLSTGEYATGKFGILMPKVKPYRNASPTTISDLFGIDGLLCVYQPQTRAGSVKFTFLCPFPPPFVALLSSEPELYLCTPVKVDYTRDYYIIGFQPNASMNVAHHMLMYGCEYPGSSQPVWNCGEMAKKEHDVEETASPCGPGGQSQIIYAWARDAPALRLPEGVGFKVGNDSPVKFIVLQVHYAVVDKFKDGSTDDSGVFVHYTTQPMYKRAGVLLIGTNGEIGPMRTEHMEAACEIVENKTLHPFAYRTHTHSLGRVVAGYKVRRDKNGKDNWIQLGKRDPLTPQMFYPIENNGTIVRGDFVAARCTMTSNRTRTTYIGSTNEDEMCNFYMMYYTNGEEPLEQKYCGSSGPPKYHWSNPDSGVNNIPYIEASTL